MKNKGSTMALDITLLSFGYLVIRFFDIGILIYRDENKYDK